MANRSRVQEVITELRSRHATIERDERDDNPTETLKIIIRALIILSEEVRDGRS